MTTATRPTLSAKEIALLLPGAWRERALVEVYPHPQTRIKVTVEQNHSMDILAYMDRERPDLSVQKFADDLIEGIGDFLSASDEAALVRVLATAMSTWQAGAKRSDDFTGDLLRSLLAEHEARQATAKENQ